MISVAGAVVAVALYLAWKYGRFSIGSGAVGALVAIAFFAGSPAANAVATGLRESAAAVGVGIQTAAVSTYAALIKE